LLLEALGRVGIKVVLLDRDYLPFPQSGSYDVVGIDNFRAGSEHTRHLIEQGCQRIFYVARSGHVCTKSARVAGYRYALSQAGLSFCDDWIRQGDVREDQFVDAIVRDQPDGIVCFHDPIAALLISAFLARDVAVPDRIKVVGFDDVKYSQLIRIPLTTLKQPCQAIGLQALNCMVERINNSPLLPRHIYLPVELIVRESTVTTKKHL